MKNIFDCKLLYIILFVCISSPSLAIMEGLSTEELTRSSELVIEGDVKDVTAEWSKDGKTIISRSTIITTNVIKGKIIQEVIVEHDGGEIGDIGFHVSDVEPLRKGEKVILFLKTGESKKYGSTLKIVGNAQGKYTIGKDGIARKRGFSVINGKEKIDNNIPVEELVDKIRRVK